MGFKTFEVLVDVSVVDYHYDRTPRFKVITTDTDPDGYKVISFNKGGIYQGADRTEIGLFLIKNSFIEETDIEEETY